jgi:Flp pilus assembly protein TadG
MSQRETGEEAGRADRRAGGRGDRGSLTLMLAVLFVALIALAGIVVDGGAKLTAAENAAAIAQEAARAGAGIVDANTAHQSGTFVVSENQAITAADSYLSQAGAGVTGQATPGPEGSDEIVVHVTVTVPTRVLSIIGITTMHASGTATANLVSGVTGPNQ